LPAARRADGHGGVNTVAPAGEQREAFARVFAGFGLGKNSGAGGNNRVGGDDKSVSLAAEKFLGGEAQRVAARRFTFAGGFVDIR
jgi:hypothetical protein